MAFRTILTTKGKQLEAGAAASGAQINLTHMAVGDGNGNPVTEAMLPAMAFLGRERYRAPVNRVEVNPDNPAQFVAELIIPAAEGGFVIREVALYTAEGEMFAIGNMPETYKPTLAEGAFSDTTIAMVFEVTNASVVTLLLNPNVALATRSWIENNITAGKLIPGGLTDQILAKASNAAGHFKWVNLSQGITIMVHSLEETQTLAANQVQVDLVSRTTDGAAVYINGTRLRPDEWTPHPTINTRFTLAVARAAGTKVTLVQNEEVGSLAGYLKRDQNLADLPDKALARTNLGLDVWFGAKSIPWSQLTANTIPVFAKRWPSWSEVTDKPDFSTNIAPHTHPWSDIQSGTIPATATRWPSYAEVTDKPSLFPPQNHTHAIADVTGLQVALDGKAPTGHTHTIAQVTGLQGALDGKAPANHTHAIAEVSGLQGALDGKQPALGYTPVRQGGGANQLNNTLYLGWNGTRLVAQVDNLDLGAFMMAGGGAFTGPISGTIASFSGAVTGASYSGGPISGTTGTFSGNVSAAKLIRTSSRRYKRGIRKITPRNALRLLAAIRFVEYTLKADGTHAAGVIAEELAGTELDFVVKRDARGRPDGVEYEPLFVIASTALQGLAGDVAKLRADVAALKKARR